MHHSDQAWLESNRNAFGPDPQSSACRVNQGALHSPQQLSSPSALSGVRSDNNALQALLDLIQCPSVSAVNVPPSLQPPTSSCTTTPSPVQRARVPLPLSNPNCNPNPNPPRMLIVSVPLPARSVQVVPSAVSSVSSLSPSSLSNVVSLLNVDCGTSNALNLQTASRPTASPSNVVHVPSAQYIDRETLDLANKVFSLYNVNDSNYMHQTQRQLPSSNIHSNSNLNATLSAAAVDALRSQSTTLGVAAHRNPTAVAMATTTGQIARGGILRVRQPGFTMPDKNGWNKPQHVPLQKQSVDITECAKPQRTTHHHHQQNQMPYRQNNGNRLVVPSMGYQMTSNLNLSLHPNATATATAMGIGMGRDSQSQSVPHSVSSSTSNSVSSSGQIAGHHHNGGNVVVMNLEKTTSSKFRCRFCDKECGSECRLEVHLRSHTGDQPYKCTMAGCGKAFKQKVNLKRHLNKHLNNGEFACSHCDRRFVYKCDLTAHQRIHSGEKPFGCNYCLKRFNQKRDLSRHLNTHSAHRQRQQSQLEAQHPSSVSALGDDT